MLEKTRALLEKATGQPKTEEEAEWWLAYRQSETMREYTGKDVAYLIQMYIQHGISYESLEDGLFEEIEEAQSEGSWAGDFEDCLTESIRNFYEPR
jgi:isocitrate lyase